MRASRTTAPSGETTQRVAVELGDLGMGGGERRHAQQHVLDRARRRRAARRGSRRAAGRCAASAASPTAARGPSGASRTATSPSSSTAWPPAPQATTGPKSGSPTTPTISSAPAGAIRCTRNPSGSWPAARTRRGHRPSGACDRRPRRQTERHAAGVGLVDEAGRDRLDRHRSAERGCAPAGRGGRRERSATRRAGCRRRARIASTARRVEPAAAVAVERVGDHGGDGVRRRCRSSAGASSGPARRHAA